MDDPSFLEAIRGLPCLACGKPPRSDPHHIKTVKTGGGDDAHNVIPLCRMHHTVGGDSWHRAGPTAFFAKFPWVWEHLQALGWEIRLDRLRHPAHDLS